MKTRSVILATSIVVIMVLNLLAGSIPVAAQEGGPLEGEGQFIRLTVQLNDSLARYAVLYGVSGSAMLAVNNLRNPDVIFPGQTIIIPVIKTRTPSLTTPFYYTVQAGDTLTKIGNAFHMDGDVIAFANNTVGDTVILGKTLLIPAGPHREIVKKGEHLGIIAARYNTTISSLLRANPSVTDPSQLFIGQRINVPIIYDARPVPITESPLAFIPETATPVPSVTPTAAPTRVPSATSAAPNLVTTLTPGDLSSGTFFFVIVVQPNESLITYQQRFGVSGSRIVAANRQLQINPDLIFPGDILVIPAIATFTPSRSTPFFYTVGGGDTVFVIADRFEMTTDTLIAANPKASFAAGTTILISAGPHQYIVKAGETLATVAAKYLVTTDFLFRYNPSVLSIDTVFAGQRIFIPVRIDASPVPFN